MKMKKVVKNCAMYRQNIKPIFFSAIAIVTLNRCSGDTLTPHKPLKPIPTIKHIDKNNTINIEPVTPGMMPVSKINKK